ncbi:MAG: SigE family RNA polymerase sigma factor [Acidimicrobiia bacterium]
MRPSDDAQVVARQEPFDAFYQREFRSVVGLAYALSGSRWAAEDLAQEAFLTAHRQWDRVGSYDSPGAWVRRVVTNMSVSLYRKRASEARAITRIAWQRQEALPELEPEDAGFWKHVRALPRRQAQALALHYLEDRPVAEVAEILQCSVSTAKVHLHKGRRALADRLGLDVGASQ